MFFSVATCIFFSSQEIFIYLQTAGHWPDFSKPEESAAVTWKRLFVGLGPGGWGFPKGLKYHRGIPYVSKPPGPKTTSQSIS